MSNPWSEAPREKSLRLALTLSVDCGTPAVCPHGLMRQEWRSGVRSNLTPPAREAHYVIGGYLRGVRVEYDEIPGWPREPQPLFHPLSGDFGASRHLTSGVFVWPSETRDYGNTWLDCAQGWPIETPTEYYPGSRELGLCDRMCPEHRRHCDAYGDGSVSNYGHVGPHACANCDEWQPR